MRKSNLRSAVDYHTKTQQVRVVRMSQRVQHNRPAKATMYGDCDTRHSGIKSVRLEIAEL